MGNVPQESLWETEAGGMQLMSKKKVIFFPVKPLQAGFLSVDYRASCCQIWLAALEGAVTDIKENNQVLGPQG